MNIGILGTGEVAQSLGNGFIATGHDVMLGSRDPNSDTVKAWKASNGPKATSGTSEQAAKFGEVIVVATVWSGTENALKLAGPKNLEGKVVIDVTNPLVFEEGKPPRLALGFSDSGGEQVQRWLPGARVVKCFNIVGHQHMFRPQFAGGPPDMFIAGNDDDAKKTVTKILSDFGWPAIDIGDISGARLLEPLCILWVNAGRRLENWHIAFKLLR
ncbi:MAG: NAD(P)-binding domain-containing protein [Candidatus Eremiobacteraeota bacterium]|nr:NAD(P)-binding domain-containing protein [Candidatus Eremiobacteraeota bacterium]